MHWILLLTSLFLPSAIPQGFISAGGSASLSFATCGAGDNSTGSSVTTLATTTCAVATGDELVIETRVGNGSVTINAPTVTGATATCTLASGSNSGPLDSGGSFIQMATCPVTAGGTAAPSCNFTSIAFPACIAVIVHGSTGNVDTSQVSSAYTSSATTNSLGSNLFTTTHANAVACAGMTYNNNTRTFTAGSIAGTTATLVQTSQATNTGSTGVECLALAGIATSQDASLNISVAENDLVVNMVAVY